MWHDHTFSQRNKATKRVEASGEGDWKKIERSGVSSIGGLHKTARLGIPAHYNIGFKLHWFRY